MTASPTWTATLTSAILALVLGVSSAAAQAVPEPDGAALYRQNCRSCHGARGVPPARMVGLYPTLKAIGDSAYLMRTPTDSIVAVLRRGKGKDMKAFADRLSPAEIVAVAKFVRTLAAPAP